MKHTARPAIIKHLTTRVLRTALLAAAVGISAASASEPVESGAGRICGVLKNFQGEVQVFDSSRTHLGDASFGTKLRCGDWVAVERGKAVVEHFSGAAVALVERSFIQILDPQSGENTDHVEFTLYRGEMMVSAPAKAKNETRIATPNAIIRISDGPAYALYSGGAEESQAIGLGGKATLENRFFPGKRMSAGFAQFVSFSDPVERLVPEAARYVNARDLNERLSKLGVPQSVRDTIEKAVKAGSKTKMPVSLASNREKTRATGEFHPGRAPASIPMDFSTPDEPAAAKRTHSGATAKSKPVKAAKKNTVARNEPDFRLKRGNEEEQEKKRLIQALSSIDAEE
jgi:hypothetical protein